MKPPPPEICFANFDLPARGRWGSRVRCSASLSGLALSALAALALSACGFRPLYATNDGAAPGLRGVALRSVSAPDEINALVRRAFERRTDRTPADARYDLVVTATDQAERLAVQIDASVTRYNYRIVGRYTLTERGTNKRIRGSVTSIASFNVVDSQYSTLFAEEAAREKAANQLAEDVERDILLEIASASPEEEDDE